MAYDPNNSHLNEKNRIIPQPMETEKWTERDADFNIKEGLTFG